MKNGKFYNIGCKGVTVKGDIESAANINISCDLVGNIHCSEAVIIDNGAVIQGNVDAQIIIVKNGKIKGNLKAHKVVDLFCNAVITGDIITQSLIADAGAIINGNCTNWLDTDDEGCDILADSLNEMKEVG